MKKIKPHYKILLAVWLLHFLIFAYGKNIYPIMTYDLFARIENFQNDQESFLAKTDSGPDFNEDISSQISFDAYWKFIVTIRRMMRENPAELHQAIKIRIQELNQKRIDKISAVRFVETKGSENKILFEVSRD